MSTLAGNTDRHTNYFLICEFQRDSRRYSGPRAGLKQRHSIVFLITSSLWAIPLAPLTLGRTTLSRYSGGYWPTAIFNVA